MRTLSYANALKTALIHIGVRKGASTYLQAWFANHKGVTYSTASGLLEHVLEVAHGERQDGRAPKVVPATRYAAGTRAVISNEHLYYCPPHVDPKLAVRFDAGFYEKMLNVAAATLKQACPEGKVLIVTRNPAAWIGSAYRHDTMRSYHPVPFQTFVRQRWGHLHAAMNYQHTAEVYRGVFGEDRVKFVPVELLRADAAKFMAEVCAFGGIDESMGHRSVFADRPRNVSMPDANIEKWRKIHQFIRIMHANSDRDPKMNAFLKSVLRGEDLGRLLLDTAVAFTYETTPRVQRIANRLFASLPDPPAWRLDWTLTPEQFDGLSAGSQFLADEPLYAPYMDQYLAYEKLPA